VTIEQHFATLAEDLVGSDATANRGRMLRAPGLRTAGRFFAFATTSDLVVKLPAKRVWELIGSDAGRPCEIQRRTTHA
jgi:hypothetical protein